MLKTRMNYNKKARLQSEPALYGARLSVRPATRDDLPPGCAWIDANNIEEAARKIYSAMVEGQSSTSIWVPPERGNMVKARKFFSASAGELFKKSWSYNLTLNDESLLRPALDYLRHVDNKFVPSLKFMTSKNLKLSFYKAARDELLRYTRAFGEATQSKEINVHTDSSRNYTAHPLSYYIHADNTPYKRALRAMIGWHGDSSYLYDSGQLVEMPSKTKEEGFFIFRPRVQTLKAWEPPSGSLVVLARGIFDQHPYAAAHSAKGHKNPEVLRPRVITKIDIRLD